MAVTKDDDREKKRVERVIDKGTVPVVVTKRPTGNAPSK